MSINRNRAPNGSEFHTAAFMFLETRRIKIQGTDPGNDFLLIIDNQIQGTGRH